MSYIPGLSLCPVEDESGRVIKIPSFIGTIDVPESHMYGNCRRIDEFERIEKISEGSFGTTYKCREKKSGELYDLQKFNMPSESKGGVPISALRQISILNVLKSINIVNCHGTVVGRSLDNNYLIQDCCSVSLDDLINKKVVAIYEESMVKCIMKQLFIGLQCIHKELIIHRGINPRNIKFTDTGVLKIGGFDSALYYQKGIEMSLEVNEVNYRAPEILLQIKEYTSAVDMWAAGCVLAELVLRKPIFDGDTVADVFHSILHILGVPTEAILPGVDRSMSQWNEGTYHFAEGKTFTKLHEILAISSGACIDIVKNLLLYFPTARLDSELSLKTCYFQEEPQASLTENLAIILHNVTDCAVPME